jgi:hypothetical protein
VPVQDKKLEKTLIHVHVSQWWCEEESIRRVLRIQMAKSI